jgi:hypothetical protein
VLLWIPISLQIDPIESSRALSSDLEQFEQLLLHLLSLERLHASNLLPTFELLGVLLLLGGITSSSSGSHNSGSLTRGRGCEDTRVSQDRRSSPAISSVSIHFERKLDSLLLETEVVLVLKVIGTLLVLRVL